MFPRDKESLGEDTASPCPAGSSSRCCSSTARTLCWQFREVLRGDETEGMEQRRGQQRSSRALSFFLHMPARSQHLVRSCEQQGLRLPEKRSGVRGIWGTGEDRELLVLGMCACVIGLL